MRRGSDRRTGEESENRWSEFRPLVRSRSGLARRRRSEPEETMGSVETLRPPGARATCALRVASRCRQQRGSGGAETLGP
ncbi:hypothetical protein NDU88_010225 [Pleurodeles waltl]|uniref:Uncharacterized protein n=1 Tax=Pleurodeles waltl TaxID=8319 RepID=A0AAV7QZP6_PLEWA|nr:hypothetical protein NDU88_010225 [Pleurodeles waltl]